MNSDPSQPAADSLRLDHFLKLAGGAETGGQAKLLIQNGDVQVNGQVETRRRRKLVAGDVVAVGGRQFRVGEQGGPTSG